MVDSITNSNKTNMIADNLVNKKLSSDLANNKSSELKDVAEQFEAIFVHQMLKQARQGKLADGIFNSEAQDTFNNMLDIEYSQILSKKNNFGIADALIKQFGSDVQLKDVK
ncbi:rod-binding protein [Alphaproteobacteria bacterium]|nr:rod-binding protein [Alphaproteobacteria bacterium]